MIGEIPGVSVEQNFSSRRELHDANVHRGLMRGIAPRGYSIVLSGGYVDDEDNGDMIIYTGEGGRDQGTGRQVADQALNGGNLALANNHREGIPVRVTRGSRLYSPYAPNNGFRYDGLYRIDDCWHDTGRDGYRIWRYRLTRLSGYKSLPKKPTLFHPAGQDQPERTKVYISRIIRNTELGNDVKAMYDHACQISGVRLDTPTGPYAEACHIRPLGRPHNGPDWIENILCLSPNMHALFDLGAITLTDDLQVVGMDDNNFITVNHTLSVECIRYHREHIYKGEKF